MISLCLQRFETRHLVGTGQSRRDHILAGGFSYAAGHAYDRDVEMRAVSLGDLFQRSFCILNNDQSFAIGQFLLMVLQVIFFDQGTCGPQFKSFLDKVMSIRSLPDDRDKERA